MPKFKSLKAAIKHINKAKADSMKDLGKKIEDIMKEEIQEQVYDSYTPVDYDRTGQFIESVKTTHTSKDRVEVSWRDSGNWYSIIKRRKGEEPDHMYVIHGHEMGKVWGQGGYRPKTNLVEESTRRVEEEIPDELIRFLHSKGIKAIKK